MAKCGFWYVILYSTIGCYTALYIALYHTVVSYTGLYCIVLSGIVWYCIVLYCTVSNYAI